MPFWWTKNCHNHDNCCVHLINCTKVFYEYLTAFFSYFLLLYFLQLALIVAFLPKKACFYSLNDCLEDKTCTSLFILKYWWWFDHFFPSFFTQNLHFLLSYFGLYINRMRRVQQGVKKNALSKKVSIFSEGKFWVNLLLPLEYLQNILYQISMIFKG